MSSNYHNKGQKDGSRNVYRPPNRPTGVDLFFGQIFGSQQRSNQSRNNERTGYNKGWSEGYKKRR